MDRYYYLAAQLPLLSFGADLQIDSGSFLRETEKWLSPSDYSILSGLSLDDFSRTGEDPPILKEYKLFESKLRHELAFWRKSRQEKGDFKPETFPISIVREASPLETEKKLLFLRWDFIEDKEGGHYFDLAFLIMYLLKIKILERLFTFNKEKGAKKFQEVCKVSYEQ